LLGPAVASELTTSTPASFATTVVMTAPPITADGSTHYKVTFTMPKMGCTVVTDVFSVDIGNPASIASFEVVPLVSITGIWVGPHTFTVDDVPAAGAHVYTVTFARTSGSGSAYLYASPTSPATLIAEEL